MVIPFLAVTNQSLWIDEAMTAIKAIQPTWGAFEHIMINDRASDVQMPLYMLFIWGWEKFAGSSEYALRAANIPWFVVGQLAILLGLGYRRKLAVAAWTSGLMNPFLWQYLDEARPYVMQYAGSSLFLVGLVLSLDVVRGNRLGGAECGLIGCGLLVLCGSSMLGIPFACAALGCAVMSCVLWGWPRKVVAKHLLWAWAAVLVGAGLLLGYYYAWTLSCGAGAARMKGNPLIGVGFAVYELTGFGGLGPGRLDLRENGFEAIRPYLLQIGWLGISYLLFVFMIIREAGQSLWHQWCGQRRLLLVLAGTLLLPTLFLVLLGRTTGFRILGRHFMPLLPLVLMGIGMGCSILWKEESGQRTGFSLSKLVIVLLAGTLCISCIMWRCASRHVKDDYRMAAAEARRVLHQGGAVWWAAAEAGAQYYKLPTESPLFRILPAEGWDGWPKPDRVILSKPDIYDAGGELHAWLVRNGYRETGSASAFRFWGAPEPRNDFPNRTP
jgi:hypothetical protein